MRTFVEASSTSSLSSLSCLCDLCFFSPSSVSLQRVVLVINIGHSSKAHGRLAQSCQASATTYFRRGSNSLIA